MSAQYPSNVSLWQKALIALAVLRALITGLWTLILSPLRGSSGAASLSKHLKLAMVRKFLENLTIVQSQYIAPQDDAVSLAWSTKERLVSKDLTLEDGTKAYWVGNPESQNVLIWYHGGGYTFPADIGHFDLASTIVKHAQSAGKDVAVLMLSYSLAPQAHYPRQLQQGVETLRHALTQLGREPGSIMMGGDSAGANLALGILSHILHPHPAIPPLSLSSPLKGLVLLGVWASFSTDYPSMKANAYKDSITPFLGDVWSANFLGKSAKDNYNEPIRTDTQWWTGLEDLVAEIFVVGGADELLLDAIKEMGKKLEEAHPKTTTLIAKDEFHDQPIMAVIGPPTGQQADGIRNWITSRL